MSAVVAHAEVFDQVRAAVAEALNVPMERVTLEASFREDLDAESLDLISIISELEEVFDQDITDEDAMSLKTVGDAVRYIQSALAKRG